MVENICKNIQKVKGKRATYNNVHMYDVNSMYPAVMMENLYPTKPGIYTENESNMRDKDGSILPGCYYAEYVQQHGRIALIKPRDQKSMRVLKDASWSGKTYATYLELNEIERKQTI